MSEKIYALLLHLYPARFRQSYQDDALELLRSRLGDQRGFLRKLRLWMDLFVDLAVALPQAYRNNYTPATDFQIVRTAAGFPAFQSLDEKPLRPGSILAGTLLAISALALFAFLMSHAPRYSPFLGSNARLNPASAGQVSNPDVQAVAEKIEAEMHAAMALQDCGFKQADLLPGNLGYVQISWLADPVTCGSTAAELANRLNQTAAVILDLRECTSGNPQMLRTMANSLGKPLFVLTSSHTFSGAELAAQEIKRLRHATIIGEAPLSAKKVLQPDIRVKAADALDTAEGLARAAAPRTR